MTQTVDWQSDLASWKHVHGGTPASGIIKQQPEDFRVVEKMDVVPIGEGEHYWLQIDKTKQNTDRVARQLARFAGVSNRDIGYSGLKDFFARTQQWFSIWLPVGDEPLWQNFEMSGVSICRVERHSRKIKRATHSANQFDIVVRDLIGEPAAINARLALIKSEGVPNYFGPQRFGRQAGNMTQLSQLFGDPRSIKDRNLRSLLFSSARSWLFNTILSARIRDSQWNQLQSGEPANLNGTGSIFTATGSSNEKDRLTSLDIHPTAPLWGKYNRKMIDAYPELHHWEQAQLEPYAAIADGLVDRRRR